MIKYTLSRKTGQLLKVERYESPRDITLKMAAPILARIIPDCLGRVEKVKFDQQPQPEQPKG
jgi:hypothetical protein